MKTQTLEEFVCTATIPQIKAKFVELREQSKLNEIKHLELIIQTHIIVGGCDELAMAFPQYASIRRAVTNKPANQPNREPQRPLSPYESQHFTTIYQLPSSKTGRTLFHFN